MPKITRLNEIEKNGRKIRGQWQLDPKHRLTYQADDSKLDPEIKEELTLDTFLVAAEPDALIFSVTQKKKNRSSETTLARLTGKWKASEQNRLEFEVERATGKNDVLAFTGKWTLNDSQEIIYSYKGNQRPQKLTFKGCWDISKRNRLAYLMEGSSDSAFRFRGAFQTQSILAKRGEIRYQLGAEAAGKQGKARSITLFGKWKLSDKMELVFEMEYSGGRKRSISFGAEFSPVKNTQITAELTGREGDSLGVEVVLTRSFMADNVKTFLRLKKSLVESAIETGVRIPW